MVKKILFAVSLALISIFAVSSAKAESVSLPNLGFYEGVKFGVGQRETSWNQDITLNPNDFQKIGTWYKIDFKLKIKNYGEKMEQNHFKGAVYINGWKFSEAYFPRLDSNQIYERTFSRWIPSVYLNDGTYTLKFKLDSNEQVMESNESDNFAFMNITLQEFNGPDLTASPKIIRPLPNQTLTNYPRKANVQWTSLDKATSYDVEVACDACSSPMWSSVKTYSTDKSQLITDPLAGDNQFRIRVRARYQNNQVGSWSNWTYFRYNTKPAVACKDIKGGNVTFLVCQGYAAYHFWSETRIYADRFDENFLTFHTTNLSDQKVTLVKGHSYRMTVISNPDKYLDVTYRGVGLWGRALIQVDSNTSYADSTDYKNRTK